MKIYPEDQLDVVRDAVHGALIARADDLTHLNKVPDPKWAIKEVAALGRLASWLDIEEILVPDRTALKVMTRIVEEVDDLDEELIELYERAIAEKVALRAFVACLGGVPPDA